MWKIRLLGTLTFLAAVAVVIGCGKKPTDSAQQPIAGTGPSPSTQPRPGPDTGGKPKQNSVEGPKLKATTLELEDAYDKDPTGANKKYGGQVLELTGEVVGSPFFNEEQIQFALGSDHPRYHSVHCITKDSAVVGRLAMGRSVRLKGRVPPGSAIAFLTEVEVLDLGPDTAIRMNSEELAKAVSGDREAMAKKLHGKTVVLTGVVVGTDTVKEDEPRFTYYEFKGDGKTRILCRQPPSSYRKGSPKVELSQKHVWACQFARIDGSNGIVQFVDCLPVPH